MDISESQAESSKQIKSTLFNPMSDFAELPDLPDLDSDCRTIELGPKNGLFAQIDN